MRLAVAVCALLLCLPAFATTQQPQPAADATKRSIAADPGIGRQLDQLGYRYEVDEDGDYKLTFDLDGGRSQLAFVISSVESYGKLRVREVWAPAYRASAEQFPADVANKLLEASQASKMGAWVKQGNMAVFVVKIAADASNDELDDAIDFVLRTADQLEAELTPGKDEF